MTFSKNIAVYITMFPQLIAGPIVRYQDIENQLNGRTPDADDFREGIPMFVKGFFKKVVLANVIGSLHTQILAMGMSNISAMTAWLGALAYTLQIFNDFSGYSDMAIGLGRMLGFEFPKNFDRPYASGSVTEFWRRWHISLGTWFREYVYIPLGGNRKGVKRQIINLLIVWALTGLWHGAAWNFIVWGLMNFVVIMVSQELEPLYEKFHKRFSVKGKVPYEAFQILRTFLLMSCIRMFDCYRDVPLTFKMVGTMFTKFNIGELFNGSLLSIGLSVADYVVLIVGFIVVFTVSLFKVRVGNVRTVLLQKPPIVYFGIMAVMIMLIIVFGAYGIGYDSSQFIYNQF